MGRGHPLPGDSTYTTLPPSHTHTHLSRVQVVYEWAKGTPFQEICQLTDVMEGSIVRAIVRLEETCRWGRLLPWLPCPFFKLQRGSGKRAGYLHELQESCSTLRLNSSRVLLSTHPPTLSPTCATNPQTRQAPT